ncbi:MAG TPA: urate hydroxylase PuuD [Pyrinomonadaceae bacterium]|jgi:uncharacterized membrane protein
MLIETSAHLPAGLAMLQDVFHAPNGEAFVRILLRWSHFVAGITWIGLLYFFNLVNVKFMKALDAPAKKTVVPNLMPRALSYFRWGAVVTVLVGLTYYAMYILAPDVRNANNIGGANVSTGVVLGVWILIPLVVFAIEFFLINRDMVKDGRVLAVIIAVLVILMAAAIVYWLTSQFTGPTGDNWASNKTYSIGIGGALGLIMLLNVWGIIWPAQKRIIAGTVSGDAAPPELARRAFLASRANAWLSLPMLFFMATSHGDYVMFGK